MTTAVDLAKQRFVDLKKKASDVVDAYGLGAQTAKVAVCLDISLSMSGMFRNGIVQDTFERLLALGVKFDDNQAIDVFLFGENSHEVGELHESKFINYVNDTILRNYDLEGSTNYAGVMKRVLSKYTAYNGGGASGFLKKLFKGNSKDPLDEPVFVIFITDGDNHDKAETEALLKEASNYGIFWKFVGVGGNDFPFLQKLDDMKGRLVDNADFITHKDIKSVGDQQLCESLLNEFSDWLKNARYFKLIK